MKKLDVLLMLLSGLFPVAGILKQIPLEQSLYIGGLLFLLVSVVILRKIYSRICSWIAYAPFITLLLVIWHQDISTSSIIANAKIAACIALIPCLFLFSYIWTYFRFIRIMGRFNMGYERSTVVSHT